MNEDAVWSESQIALNTGSTANAQIRASPLTNNSHITQSWRDDIAMLRVEGGPIPLGDKLTDANHCFVDADIRRHALEKFLLQHFRQDIGFEDFGRPNIGSRALGIDRTDRQRRVVEESA